MGGVGRRIESGVGASAKGRSTSPGRATDAGRSKSAAGFFVRLFALIVLVAIGYGFLHRDDNWITPEHGLGYLAGIVGSVFMLILLSYPLRKRFRSLRGWGRLPSWLNFHMLLGILGPTLVLFHANFRLGATNSNVALFAMITVVGSGIVGRYIYSKTHNRLSGELRSLQDIRAEAQAARQELQFDFTQVPALQHELDDLEARILDPDHGVLSSTWLALSMDGHRRRLLRLLKAAITSVASQHGLDRKQTRLQVEAASRFLSAYLGRLQRAAEFRFFERMFSLWHVLHVPLLFLLIAAAVVHVAAVHLY